MRSLLNHHVEAFERSADELRTQASNPRGALASQSDIEFLMATLVGHFNALGAAVARHQAAPSPATDDDMREIHRSCRRLAPIFDQVLGHGSAIERAGGRVAGKSEFLAAWRELKGIVAIDPDGVAESFAQLRRGEGRSLGEFADELSRDLEP